MSTVHVQVLMIAEATSEHHRPDRSLLWYNSTVQNLLDAWGRTKSSRRLIPILVKYHTLTHPPAISDLDNRDTSLLPYEFI